LKKIFLIIFFITLLFADSIEDVKAKIVKNIAHIFTKCKVVKVYTDDPYFFDIFQSNTKIKRVNDCKDADIILTKNSKDIKNICKKRKAYIFSTRYNDYKKSINFDLGAFFWQKGRPTLLINRYMINKMHIHIPDSYKKFLD